MASRNSTSSGASGSGRKTTDFDAILLEGLHALASRVQEHHERLQAQHLLPRGEAPPRTPPPPGKLPSLDEEGEEEAVSPPSTGARVLSDIMPRQEPTSSKGKFDLLQRWQSLEGLRGQDSSSAVASALYHQDEAESIEGSEDEKSSSTHRSPGPAARCWRKVNTCMTPWMISPNSVLRSCWDSLACIFVIWECIMIPLAFFDIGESAFLDVVAWIVRIFWSVDFPLSCLTGYFLPGDIVEMRPKKVLPHYAKTWMSLDVSMLCVDWAEVVIGGGGMESLNAARMGKTVKSLRMIRMMRLWRLLNVNHLPESVKVLIHHYFQSEVSRIVLDICKILIFLVWINHVLACCWYGIADSVIDGVSWLQQPRFQDQFFTLLYVTCFHWSLTQFAGSTDVYPSNVYERTFAVCSLVFCFIISASIVSSITTSMTRLSIARSKETTKLAALKEYLREHHISSRTALRVQRNAQYALEEQKRHTPEEDIELLAFLSEPLRVELRYEITMPTVRKHGFFQVLEQESPALTRQLCYQACVTTMLSKADILFVQGAVQHVHQMYFCTDGKLSYFKDSSIGLHTKGSSQRTNILRKKDKVTVGEGDWMSEPALWTAWTHCGTMRAKTQCTVLSLSADDLHGITSQFKDVAPCLQNYARRLVKHLSTKESSDLSDLNDVEWDSSDMAREAFRSAEQDGHQRGGTLLKRGASINNFFRQGPLGTEERPNWFNSLMGRIERTRTNKAARSTLSGDSAAASVVPEHKADDDAQ